MMTASYGAVNPSIPATHAETSKLWMVFSRQGIMNR